MDAESLQIHAVDVHHSILDAFVFENNALFFFHEYAYFVLRTGNIKKRVDLFDSGDSFSAISTNVAVDFRSQKSDVIVSAGTVYAQASTRL